MNNPYKLPVLQKGWLPLILVTVITISTLSISVIALYVGWLTVFQNVLYFPIILACVYYGKRGFVFSIILACCYYILVDVFSHDPAVLWGALVRVLIFILVAGVITYLSLVRTRAENALKESEEFNRKLVENMPELVMVYDQDRKIQYANPKAASVLGYSPGEMAGSDILTYIAPRQHIEITSAIQERFSSGTGKSLEIELITKSGQPLTVVSRGAPVHFRNRHAVLLLLSDISDRKQAEIELRESEKRYRDMFELNSAVMLIVDPGTGAVVDANSAASRYYGYSHEEITRLRITEINIADPEVTNKNMSRAAENHGMVFEFRHRKKDGEIREVTVFSAPVSFKGRRVLHSIIEDVTERKRAETALQLAIKKLNMLSSITRHDILNQIMGLRTFLELSKNNPTTTQLAGYIEKEDQAAAAIQRQIEFTKYYQDIGMNAPKWQDVAVLIDSAVRQLSTRGIEIQVLVSGAEIFADPLLEKVFYNLVENSLRHGEHVTRMSFSMERTDPGLVIVYTDNGVGISAEDKHKLFQRGFGKHTGLGLFLSREILSITGLGITENGEPKKGVRFEILVPEGAFRFANSQGFKQPRG